MKYALKAQVEGCSMISPLRCCSNGNHTPEKSCGFSTGPCKKPFSTKQTWGSLEITQAPNNSSLQTKGVNQKEMVNFTDNKLLNEGLAWSATRSLQRTHSYTSAMDDYWGSVWISNFFPLFLAIFFRFSLGQFLPAFGILFMSKTGAPKWSHTTGCG